MELPQRLAALAVPALLGCVFFPGLSSARADVTVNPIFGDHMVLQRERLVPVWGQAGAGEKVSVSFGNQARNVAAGVDGRWMVFLDPMPASAAPRTLTVRGRNQVAISDVLVGDVWLGTGQSNMDLQMYHTNRADEIRHAPPGAFAGIRLFIVAQASADTPQREIAGGNWQEPSTENIMQFSATLFYFGEELHQRVPGVPLGLIRSSVGATNLYSWIPNEVRDADSAASYLRTWWKGATKNWTPAAQAKRDQELADYNAQVAAYKQRGEKLPATLKQPGELTGPKWSRRPSSLYNGMIAPLQPLAIRGMIWYQGEWDSKPGWASGYYDLFLPFAKSWRAHWAEAAGKAGSGDFPIYIVQLPARDPADDNGKFWPFVREAEARLAAAVPQSGYVVTFDTNDPANMHPVEKTPVGQRLAWLALGKTYGAKIPWHGPELKVVHPSGNGLLLEFDPGDKAIVSKDEQPLRWFELAGADGIYHPAVAEIRGGNQILVSSAQVSRPATVRYAFAPAAQNPNFFNSAGLPAGPFRTDKQPVPEK